MRKKIVRGMIVVLILMLIWIAVGIWREQTSSISLPVPTGSYAVGRSNPVWYRDPDTRSSDARHPLLGWIWYPVDKSPSLPATTAYLPPSWNTVADAMRGRWWLPRLLNKNPMLVHAHSIQEAKPAAGKFPVILLRPGLSAMTVKYSALAEDLASHGYIVAGFDVPYRTMAVVMPDGQIAWRSAENDAENGTASDSAIIAKKLLLAWTADAGVVLDRLTALNQGVTASALTGKLDMTRIGLAGHSLGGDTATQFCAKDGRCKAGVDIDGALHGSEVATGVHVPFMFLLGEHRGEPEVQTRKIEQDIQSVYAGLPAGGAWYIVIRGANHYGFSDDVFLKSQLGQRYLQALGIIQMPEPRQLQITSYSLLGFFDRYLKQNAGAALENSSQDFPEMQISRH